MKISDWIVDLLPFVALPAAAALNLFVCHWWSKHL
jgi:hypothetical protein